MVIYAVLGGFAGTGPPGHVFRTTLTAARWTDISPDLDAPFGALALDGQDTPTTIYVGTDVGGVLRSVDLGATWTVLDDLHFPGAAPTGEHRAWVQGPDLCPQPRADHSRRVGRLAGQHRGQQQRCVYPQGRLGGGRQPGRPGRAGDNDYGRGGEQS